MNRKQKIIRLLSLYRSVNEAYHKYLTLPREYYPGEKLYMREVHIVVEIGLDGVENVSDLAERLKVTPGAVSQQLSKLEKKGFIQRDLVPNDRRQCTVTLTEKGRELYRLHSEFDAERYAVACGYFQEFSDSELEIVERFELQFSKFITNAVNRRDTTGFLLKSDANADGGSDASF